MPPENNEEPTIKPEATWFIDEGLPGIGDRPAWLPEKYKTAADLGKAYSELQKKMGEAPPEYDFSKSRYLDPEYEPFNELKIIAKEKRVPQEVIDKMLESVDKYVDEFSTDYSQEIKKLGDDAETRVNQLDNWAKANLSKDSYDALTRSVNNAGSILALEELRGKMMSNNPQVPNGNSGTISTPTSVGDVQKEISDNYAKYKSDESYRKDVQRRLEAAVKATPGYVDKLGA